MATSMLGFDIGAAQLKIAYWDGSAVKKLVAVDMPDNMVKNEEIISYDAMADFIKETLGNAKLKERKAAVILPSSQAFLRRVTVPFMTGDQLKVNLPYEFRDFLNETKDKYIYDYFVSETINGEDGKPAELDILASAMSKDVLLKYREMFHRAGLKLEIAIPREASYVNIIKKLGDAEKREYAFLDLGHLGSRLDIFTGTSFETTRTIEMGLKDLDLAIADSENVDEHVARSYKVLNYKGCQDTEDARRLYDVISGDLRKTINFYGFSNRESNLHEVYLCGGGANIETLVANIRENLDDMEFLEIKELLPPVKDTENDPSAFAAAIGATMQLSRAGEDNINLIIKEKTKLPVGKTVIGLVLVLAAVFAFSKFLVIDRFAKADALDGQARALEARNDELQEYLVDYDEIAAKYAKYSVSWMSESEQSLVERSKILKVVDEELMPKCTVLNLSISGNTASTNITDCSLDDVSKLVESIQARPEIRNVLMRSASTDDSTGDLNIAVIVFSLKNAGEIQ